MQTIILPGYSPRNREWAESIAAELPLAVVHRWAHWEAVDTFDAAAEVSAILKEIRSAKGNLLAKSVGCRVAALVLRKVPGQIERLILCGIPGTGEDIRADIAAGLADLPPENILVVQNRADPYARFAEVQAMMLGISPAVQVMERLRKDHHCPYPQDFKDFLADGA